MTVDVTTLGSSLQLAAGVTEAEALSGARAALTSTAPDALWGPEAYKDSDPYRWADYSDIENYQHLDHLFAAFRLLVVRDEDGNIVSAYGHDDAWHDHRFLFGALAPYLDPRSWHAFTVDFTSTQIYTFADGTLHTNEYPADALDAENEISAQVRTLMERPHLNDGHVPPALTTFEKYQLLLERTSPLPGE